MAQLSPEATGMVSLRNRAAQIMALRLGETGSGLFLNEVQQFQIAWNQALPATREQMQIVGFSQAQANAMTERLDEDGQFGRHTSGALYIIIGDPQPPLRASGMPAWVNANMARIMALAGPGEPSMSETLSPEVVIDTNPQVQPSTGGAIVVEQIDGTTQSGPDMPVPMIDAICDPGINLPPGCTRYPDGTYTCGPEVTAQQLYDAGCLTLSQYQAALEEGPLPMEYDAVPHEVPTTRPASKVPGVAILVGVGVLGSAFWWMVRRNKKRGRA